MKRVLFTILLFLIGCTPTAIPTPTLSPNTCLGFTVLSDTPYHCSEEDNLALVESSGQQLTLEGFGASIVIQGQIEILQSEQKITIHVISGTAVVGARGRNRIVSVSNTIELSLVNGSAQAPSEATSIPTASPIPIEITEIVEIESSTIADGECTPREDWEQSYTVKSGDTLAEIAENYGLTIDEIAQANCLDDPSRLRVGQVLRIAGNAPTATSAPNSSTIAFRADSYSLTEGECTTLRWDAFNTAEVRLSTGEILVDSFLEVCLVETTTFTLNVIFLDGTEAEGELTITVEED